MKHFERDSIIGLEYESYDESRLNVSKKHLRSAILTIAVFNLFLLIPDIIMIVHTEKQMIVIVMRLLFSLSLIYLFFSTPKIQTFDRFAKIVSAYEIAGIMIFMIVLNFYEKPNFMIQTMGLMLLTIIIFLIPNKLKYMITVTLAGTGVYLAYFAFIDMRVATFAYTAAFIYMFFVVGFCAVSARITERFQYSEFNAKNELIKISSIDPLTKAGNRYKFEKEANWWIEFCRRQDLPLSFVMIDIDDFKIINDLNGHLSGDTIMVELVKIFNEQLRSTDLLYRWGGDEFVVLLPNVQLSRAITVCERIRQRIEEFIYDKQSRVTCSFGIVACTDESDYTTLVDEADKLMYRGKKKGKNIIQFSE